jgi:hypothetical protein
MIGQISRLAEAPRRGEKLERPSRRRDGRRITRAWAVETMEGNSL